MRKFLEVVPGYRPALILYHTLLLHPHELVQIDKTRRDYLKVAVGRNGL